MLSDLVKIARKHPFLGPQLVSLNVLFCAGVYGLYVALSWTIAQHRQALFDMASATVAQKFLLLFVLLGIMIFLPFLVYVTVRLGILRITQQALAMKVSSWSEWPWRFWALAKFLALWALIVGSWLWLMTLLRSEFMGWSALISGLVLALFALLWLQSLALCDSRKQPIRSSLDHLGPFLRASGPLVVSSLGILLIIVGAFYLGGNFWAASFSKVVYVTTKEWERYVWLFRATLLFAGLLMLSTAQVYYALVMKNKPLKPHRKS